MQRIIFSIFLLFAIVLSVAGQDVKITTAFDSTRIHVGDQIKYTITVDKPAGLKLQLPVFKDTICKHIDIISGPKTDSSSLQNARTRIIQKYIVTSFDSGKYEIKPIYGELKTAGGLKRFYSDYSLLEVLKFTVAPRDTTAKIYDIIAPYRAPLTLGEVLPWVLLALLIAGLGWFAYRYYKAHRKAKEEGAEYIPADPAHVIAFRELEILRDEQLWQKGETKRYYTRLTEILRQYLENRYRVYSLELTTAETLEALVKTGFKKEGPYNDLKSVLTGADLVKFAKYNPDAIENDLHFQSAWKFVEMTMETGEIPGAVDQTIMEKEAIR